MRKQYALVIALATTMASISTAQTLTHTTTSPVVGDQVISYQVGYQAPTAPGAGQTWDLSSLPTTTAVVSNYVTPASTGQSGSFPGANLATDDSDGGYAYLNASTDGLDVLGAYSTNGAIAIPYQNPERIIDYPCSFGTTWTDQFSSNYIAGGFPTERAGSITGEADASGTLIMPYGTVSNVLRIHTHEVFSDVSDFFTIEYDYHTYFYYTPGTHAPIYTSYDHITTINGAPQAAQFAVWTANTSIGMDEAVNDAIGIDVFPNPASEQIAVIYSSNGSMSEMQLIDATGRMVRAEVLGATTIGIARTDVSVADLAPGAYLLRIISSNGGQGTKRLVIQ